MKMRNFTGRRTDQNVVRLDVGMQNSALLHVPQSQEQLLGVGTNSLDVQPDVFPVLLQHLNTRKIISQVHKSERKQKMNEPLEDSWPKARKPCINAACE